MPKKNVRRGKSKDEFPEALVPYSNGPRFGDFVVAKNVREESNGFCAWTPPKTKLARHSFEGIGSMSSPDFGRVVLVGTTDAEPSVANMVNRRRTT